MADGQMTAEPASRHEVVTVVSPKGGVGRTTVASNLAAVLARSGPTFLVDGDLYCGDVEFALGIRPVYRLDDLVLQSATNPDLDPRTMLTRRGDGLSVICAPKNPFMADQLDTRATWKAITDVLDHVDQTVIDTGPGLGPLTISSMDAATRIILVCGTDTASVNAARTLLGVADQLSLDRKKILLVVDRPAPRAGLHLDDVAQILGIRPTTVIPDDPAVTTAMNKGIPFVEAAPNVPAAKSIVALANKFTNPPTPATRQRTEGEP